MCYIYIYNIYTITIISIHIDVLPEEAADLARGLGLVGGEQRLDAPQRLNNTNLNISYAIRYIYSILIC